MTIKMLDLTKILKSRRNMCELWIDPQLFVMQVLAPKFKHCTTVKSFLMHFSHNRWKYIYLAFMRIHLLVIYMNHSSKIGCLSLMKWPSELLHNLPYFWNMKTHVLFYFSFHATLFSSLMNVLVFVEIDQGMH